MPQTNEVPIVSAEDIFSLGLPSTLARLARVPNGQPFLQLNWGRLLGELTDSEDPSSGL